MHARAAQGWLFISRLLSGRVQTRRSVHGGPISLPPHTPLAAEHFGVQAAARPGGHLSAMAWCKGCECVRCDACADGEERGLVRCRCTSRPPLAACLSVYAQSTSHSRRQQAARTLHGPHVTRWHRDPSQQCTGELHLADGGRAGRREAPVRLGALSPLSSFRALLMGRRARASAGATRGCPTCPPRSRRGGILGAGALASYEEQEAVARATARPWRADRVVASERLSARP